VRQYGLYIFDLDGTLYRGSEALPGAGETVRELRRRGAATRFLTNNSSQTPEAQSAKLRGMGIESAPEEILTSGVGAATYLTEQKLNSAFVVGEPGLIEVLAGQGIYSAASQETADAVLVGICRQFTYDLLNKAMQHILNGATFVATNTDASYPLEAGKLIPGAGAIVAAVQTCTGADPFVVGKPNPFLIELLLKETGVAPGDTLVIGDRYETDIVSGQRAGCDTLLVLTGVTKTAPEGQPTIDRLTALVL
jgi:4-nitrophenyl phosphatase